MPSGVSDFGAATWLAALFGVIEPITGYYVALCADEPGPDIDGDMLADLEPGTADPTYQRVFYGVGAGNWGTNGNFLTTTNDVDFGLPGADWGIVNHFALCDQPSGGDIYAWGEFLNPQYVGADVQMLVPAGGLVLTLSSLDNSIAI